MLDRKVYRKPAAFIRVVIADVVCLVQIFKLRPYRFKPYCQTEIAGEPAQVKFIYRQVFPRYDKWFTRVEPAPADCLQTSAAAVYDLVVAAARGCLKTWERSGMLLPGS